MLVAPVVVTATAPPVLKSVWAPDEDRDSAVSVVTATLFSSTVTPVKSVRPCRYTAPSTPGRTTTSPPFVTPVPATRDTSPARPLKSVANPAPLVNVVAATPAAPPAQTPAPAQHNGFARNLAGQIRGVSFSEGTTRIELTPQGLGKLEIEISPDEAGKLRVVIRAENPAVLNAMRSDREMLAGLLRDGGTSVDDSAMSFEDLGQRRGTAGQDEAGTLAASAPPVADEDELPQETAPPVGDGRLNILT